MEGAPGGGTSVSCMGISCMGIFKLSDLKGITCKLGTSRVETIFPVPCFTWTMGTSLEMTSYSSSKGISWVQGTPRGELVDVLEVASAARLSKTGIILEFLNLPASLIKSLSIVIFRLRCAVLVGPLL